MNNIILKLSSFIKNNQFSECLKLIDEDINHEKNFNDSCSRS